MIIEVASCPEIVTKGDVVAFLFGKRSVNHYPRELKIGTVVVGYNDSPHYEGKTLTIKELYTGKIYHPYGIDLILVNGGIDVRGVGVKLTLTDKV